MLWTVELAESVVQTRMVFAWAVTHSDKSDNGYSEFITRNDFSHMVCGWKENSASSIIYLFKIASLILLTA